MKIARIIAMLLLVAMCLTMIVACNDDDTSATTTASQGDPAKPSNTTTAPSGPDDPTPSGSVTTTVPTVTTQPKDVDDNVGTQNFGKTFNVLAWEQDIKEYDLDELGDDSDDVDAALYNRNRTVEERLGLTEIKFNEILGSGNGENGGIVQFVNTVETSVKTNMQAYDAIAAYTRCGGQLGQRGVYEDLFEVEHIDTDMPWWPEEMITQNTVADRLFFATGDIATSLIYQMYFLIINQELAEEFTIDVDELQQSVLDGDGAKGGWTLDVFFDITANRYKKLDSEATNKSANDRYGFYCTAHNVLDIFYMGAGLKYVETSEEGLKVSPDFSGTESQGILKRFSDAQKSDDGYACVTGTSGSVIVNGNSLIYPVSGGTLAGSLRNAAFTYRILPGPKYNSDQLDYYVPVGFPHSLYSIPTDAKDQTMSGAVLEVMASESWRQVTPVLFEKVFLYKLTNDVLDMEILQLIRNRTTWDLGRTFFEELGADTNSQVRLWRNMLMAKSVKIVQQAKGHMDRWNGTLGEIYDDFAA